MLGRAAMGFGAALGALAGLILGLLFAALGAGLDTGGVLLIALAGAAGGALALRFLARPRVLRWLALAAAQRLVGRRIGRR